MKELSILIPARHEEYLYKTIEDILEHSEADIEINVVLDGAWPKPGVPQDDRVNMIYVAESIGQREAINRACAISKAKYVMKIDAHCAVDQGFDRKMIDFMKEQGDDVTAVPVMRHLWAFDWQCEKCGSRWYQGPQPTRCMTQERHVVPNEACDERNNFKKVITWLTESPDEGTARKNWKGRYSPRHTAYCFDSEPHFQYNGQYGSRRGYKEGIIVGYELSFDSSVPSGVISLFADLADSHQLAGSRDALWRGQNMASDAVSLSAVDDGGSVRAEKIDRITDELKMKGITAPSVLAKMIYNGNILTPPARERANEPSIGKSMYKCFLAAKGEPRITISSDASNPIPAAGSRLNTDVIDKLNRILGGEFVYNEKTRSFHNKNVTLSLVRDQSMSYTMSIQGSCFMMTREKYLELNICDHEGFGSWGSQGIEVACKTWLSGGRVMVNHNTWYGHLFRTQGGTFSFPYPQDNRQVRHAKHHAHKVMHENTWTHQKYPLSWLLEKFWPVPGWTDAELADLKNKPFKKQG